MPDDLISVETEIKKLIDENNTLNDKEDIVREAVFKKDTLDDLESFQYTSNRLQNKRSIILEIVYKSNKLLKFISESLQTGLQSC